MNERLEIFRKANFIDEKDIMVLNKILVLLSQYQSISSEKIEMFITHMVMVISREKNKISIEELNDEIFNEVENSEFYEESNILYGKINQLVNINEKEKKYILFHLINIMEDDSK